MYPLRGSPHSVSARTRTYRARVSEVLPLGTVTQGLRPASQAFCLMVQRSIGVRSRLIALERLFEVFARSPLETYFVLVLDPLTYLSP